MLQGRRLCWPGVCLIVLVAASVVAQQPEPDFFQIRGRYQWQMHDFEDLALDQDKVSRATVTLTFEGRLELTPLNAGRWSVRWRARRLHFKVGPDNRFGTSTDFAARQWTINQFDDRDRLREHFQEVIVYYRPILRFADAAAYETEALGAMLALMDGESVRIDTRRPPFHPDPLQSQTDALLAEWAPPWPEDATARTRWDTLWRDGAAGGAGYYLPHHTRLRALLWNHMKNLTLFVTRPGYRHLPTGQTMFAGLDPLSGAGELRTQARVRHELGKKPDQPLPAFSAPALYGWIPVSDIAMTIQPRFAHLVDPAPNHDDDRHDAHDEHDAYDQYYSIVDRQWLSDLKLRVAEQRDRRRISDARRGKHRLPRPLTTDRAIVAAQRLREAEARLELLERAETVLSRIDAYQRDRKRDRRRPHRHGLLTRRPVFRRGPIKPWQLEDYVASSLQRAGTDHLWVLAERAIDHEVKTDRATRVDDNTVALRRVTTRTEVPSSPAVRLYEPTGGSIAQSGNFDDALEHTRGRVRLEATVQLEAVQR
jgi:hypothetical protein